VILAFFTDFGNAKGHQIGDLVLIQTFQLIFAIYYAIEDPGAEQLLFSDLRYY